MAALAFSSDTGRWLKPLSVFAHYLGDDEAVYGRFERAHRCNRYDLILEP